MPGNTACDRCCIATTFVYVHVLLSDRMWDRVMLKEPQGLNTAAASNPRAR